MTDSPENSAQNALFSVDAEQSVLGAVLLDNEAYYKLVGVITEHDFNSRDHRLIFRAMANLLDNNKPADVVTVAEYLDSHKLLDDAGGIMYFAQLAQNTPSAQTIVRYAEIVRDYSLMRKMAQISTEITDKIHNRKGASAQELLDFAQSRWMTVGETFTRAKNTLQPMSEVLKSVVEKIDENYIAGKQDDVTGLRTGLVDLDNKTSGMQPGQLIIIGARPAMGKTSLALNIVENVALEEKQNALVFSLEMNNQQLGTRLLSSVSKLNSQRVSVGRLNEDEWSILTSGISKLHSAGIYLDEESTLSVNDIKARARKLYRELKGQLSLIVVDYLQLISVPGKDTKANEMSDVSRHLKLLAKELNVPVIALSQLNRGLEQRFDKRPVMSDLRDSGAIEQDADNIYFIYRDEVYNPDTQAKGIAEIIIAKQRSGPIGTVVTSFLGHLTRFENFAPAEYGDYQPPPTQPKKQGKFARNFSATKNQDS